MQELEIGKHQGFNIVHKVKYKICLRYKRQISKFYYFAWSIIWQFSVIKISIRCAMYNIEFAFITKVKISKLFCIMQNLKVFKDHAFCIVHHVKYKFCVHYETQIWKFLYFA